MQGLDTVVSTCPYCAEAIEMVVDTSVTRQRYIEDCAVCCRPIDVDVRARPGEPPLLELRREDEA